MGGGEERYKYRKQEGQNKMLNCNGRYWCEFTVSNIYRDR